MQRAQASLAKAAHDPHNAWIPDLESQRGDLDHSHKFNQLFLVSLQSYSTYFIKIRS